MVQELAKIVMPQIAINRDQAAEVQRTQAGNLK
jgi:hypothetical protein